MAVTWSQLLAQLLAGTALTRSDTAWAMGEILADAATPSQIAGFAIALRAKGETPAEITGLVDAMLSVCAPLTVPAGARAVDTCGTGGDGAHTVNVSTMAAIVVAACGQLVVKHGNRAASSSSGSADVLEALGVAVSLSPTAVSTCLDEAGIGFCFAPVFHPAMRFAAVPRRELGVPTFFNILGPLANPARPAVQAVGVADARLAPVVASVLAGRGASALVVRGDDGLDEITLSGTTSVWEVRDGLVTFGTLTPELMGVEAAPVSALLGGDAAHNAGVARSVFDGSLTGPIRDAVLVNAAAALVAAEPADGRDLAARIRAGIDRAAVAIDDGSAERLLHRWVEVSAALA